MTNPPGELCLENILVPFPLYRLSVEGSLAKCRKLSALFSIMGGRANDELCQDKVALSPVFLGYLLVRVFKSQ